MADKLDVNLEKAVAEKIVKNGEKYPVRLSKGSAKKSTDLRSKIKGMLEL
jgi:hypothetical protein